jgi:hypothetical protein
MPITGIAACCALVASGHAFLIAVRRIRYGADFGLDPDIAPLPGWAKKRRMALQQYTSVCWTELAPDAVRSNDGTALTPLT